MFRIALHCNEFDNKIQQIVQTIINEFDHRIVNISRHLEPYKHLVENDIIILYKPNNNTYKKLFRFDAITKQHMGKIYGIDVIDKNKLVSETNNIINELKNKTTFGYRCVKHNDIVEKINCQINTKMFGHMQQHNNDFLIVNLGLKLQDVFITTLRKKYNTTIYYLIGFSEDELVGLVGNYVEYKHLSIPIYSNIKTKNNVVYVGDFDQEIINLEYILWVGEQLPFVKFKFIVDRKPKNYESFKLLCNDVKRQFKNIQIISPIIDDVSIERYNKNSLFWAPYNRVNVEVYNPFFDLPTLTPVGFDADYNYDSFDSCINQIKKTCF